MNKLEFGNTLEALIKKYESEEYSTMSERIEVLKKVIVVGREYNAKYKTPHKHYFMGKPIKYTDALLNALEVVIEKANHLKTT